MQARIELIEAAQRGHPEAIAELLAVCQPDIRRFARRTCTHAEDAEDAVQLALWQLYRKVGALRTAATFATWLFRIVERECYRLFRIRSRTEPFDDASVEAIAAPDVPLDLRLDLAKAIAALPVPYRTVFILRDIDEVTAPEAAAQLAISVEAVKSRLHRARAMVRERLMASGYWSASDEEARQ
jgi:RNA polymerase sigma factor (sigma-70 family)